MTMKKYLLTTFLFSACSLAAQVGINTDYPRALFHVDGAGDNPQDMTTALNATQVANDVVVNTSGNVGVGILSPTAKLHVVTNASTPRGLRLYDGTASLNNKVLQSNANGDASWVSVPTSGGSIHNVNPASVVRYPYNVNTLLFSTLVNVAGNYLVTIRWWGTASAVANNRTSAYFTLCSGTGNGTAWGTDPQHDRIEYYVQTNAANQRFCFATTLFASISAGRYLKIYIQPVIGGGSWNIGTVNSNYLWNPSIVLFRV